MLVASAPHNKLLQYSNLVNSTARATVGQVHSLGPSVDRIDGTYYVDDGYCAVTNNNVGQISRTIRDLACPEVDDRSFTVYLQIK